MNAAQDRRPEPDFCYLLRGNITPESQYRKSNPILFDYSIKEEKKFMNDILAKEIINFITVLDSCLIETTYANDREVYLKDIARAVHWLAELNRGADPQKVKEHILSPQTDKNFGDYWRNGVWGDREMAALKKLQVAIQSQV